MKRAILWILAVTLLVVMCFACAACKGAVGIKGIKKTGSEGLVDTYTITLTDGSTSTFTVTNGSGGGADIATDTYTPNHYFRFELLDDDTYAVEARYIDMYPTVVIPSNYNGKAVTHIGYLTQSSIDNIVIPTTINFIERIATFTGEINYKGTINEWNAIQKEADWNRSIKTIHCTDGDINLD